MMKKKIIIFTSSGGGGHISASNALYSYLHHDFDIKIVFLFNEVYKGFDPITIFTFGKATGETLYNYFLKKRWTKLLNFMYTIGNWYFWIQTKFLIKKTERYLINQKPDLIISVIPIINNVLLAATQHQNIPFLLVPTDLDLSTFIVHLKNPTYNKFHMTIAFDDPLIKNTYQKAHIQNKYISATGLPMRKEFLEPQNASHTKKEFNIESHKPVILLMMGMQGSSNIYNFAQELSKLTIPAHLLICIGKNKELKKLLEKITFRAPVTVTIVEYIQNIAQLFSIADLLITKSGSVSFCEGIYMNIPMILDATGTLLYWERLNHTFLKEHNFGISIENLSDLNTLVNRFLTDTSYYETIKKNLENYPKKRIDLAIQPIIKDLLT